jgi:hypothetical protein
LSIFFRVYEELNMFPTYTAHVTRHSPVMPLTRDEFDAAIRNDILPVMNAIVNNPDVYGSDEKPIKDGGSDDDFEVYSKEEDKDSGNRLRQKARDGLEKFRELTPEDKKTQGYHYEYESDLSRYPDSFYLGYPLDGQYVSVGAYRIASLEDQPEYMKWEADVRYERDSGGNVEEVMSKKPKPEALPFTLQEVWKLASPAVEQGGDILTEHALNMVGPEGRIISELANGHAEARHTELGGDFVNIDNLFFIGVLETKGNPNWVVHPEDYKQGPRIQRVHKDSGVPYNAYLRNENPGR